MSERDDILDDAGADLRRAGGFSPATLRAIKNSARWGRYYLYLVAASVLVTLISQTVSAQTSALGAAALAGNLVSYVFLFAIVAYPVYQFHRFATLPDRGDPDEAVVALGATMKYLGILTVLMVGLYVGLLLLALAVMAITMNVS